jgi:hypothetical protein
MCPIGLVEFRDLTSSYVLPTCFAAFDSYDALRGERRDFVGGFSSFENSILAMGGSLPCSWAIDS